MKRILVCIMAMALLLSACADKKEYAATVGGEKITADEVKFYLESVKSQMAGTELSSDEDWQTKEIEGRKAIDLAKERAVDTAVDNVAYIEVAKALDLKLTSDEKKEIASNKSQFKMQFGGEEFYKEFLKMNNIDDEFIGMLCEAMVYTNKLVEKINAEEPLSDEEISAYFEENKEDLTTTYRKAKHILILTKNMDTGVELSAEEQEQAKIKAEDVLKRAKAGEDFDALAKEFSQDPGLLTNPDGYVFSDGEMVPEFQDGVDALKNGELGICKSDFGYHVLLRLGIEEADLKDRIKSLIEAKKLEEHMDIWMSEEEIKAEINDEVVAEIE